jgi:hypothetical protein
MQHYLGSLAIHEEDYSSASMMIWNATRAVENDGGGPAFVRA